MWDNTKKQLDEAVRLHKSEPDPDFRLVSDLSIQNAYEYIESARWAADRYCAEYAEPSWVSLFDGEVIFYWYYGEGHRRYIYIENDDLSTMDVKPGSEAVWSECTFHH